MERDWDFGWILFWFGDRSHGQGCWHGRGSWSRGKELVNTSVGLLARLGV
jgi:hypothetical protein